MPIFCSHKKALEDNQIMHVYQEKIPDVIQKLNVSYQVPIFIRRTDINYLLQSTKRNSC